MGFDIGDLGDKAKDFLESDQVQDALKSEQAEDISDNVLDKLEEVADDATGGKFSDQISAARDAADGAVGTD
ncbi:MAG: antitoxin protein [Leifsonia sp.]|nr:antitoxin protein [Leifsonia sp.]|tara:strand:+ start:348705 stop:348920 length:216 start_codon:yes stop_codon:yes gene_type:complete